MEFIKTWWKRPNDTLFLKKLSLEFFQCIIVMFQLAMILPNWPPKGSFYVVPILIQNLCIFHPNQLNLCMHHCATGLLKIN